MIPFSYAVIDDEGEVIRKHRWSVKEAKWFTEKNPDVKVIKPFLSRSLILWWLPCACRMIWFLLALG